MIKKPEWLFKGAIVKALGEKGVVTKCPTNELKGDVYVYSCSVKLEGAKRSDMYHPSDLAQIE